MTNRKKASSFEASISKDRCVVALQHDTWVIPVVGINQTAGGFFINYYLNKIHPFFGPTPHESRHHSLIAARYSRSHDIYSASENVRSIDDRDTPEELPCRSVTPDLLLPWMPRREFDKLVKVPLLVPAVECEYGMLVRVTVWPRFMSPTAEEMRDVWTTPSRREPLVRVFLPSCFANRVSVAVFSVDNLIQELPFFIDGSIQSSDQGPVYSNPIMLHGRRKGRTP